MNVIIIVHTYKLFTIVMIIFAISYFLGIFWLIYVRDIESWEYMTIYDVYYGYSTFYSLPDYGFIKEDGS